MIPQEKKSNVIEILNRDERKDIKKKEYRFNRNLADREVSVDMTENAYLEKYIEKLENDRIEQEKRISTNMQHMEQRITEERRLSEERMEKRFEQTMQAVENSNKKIDGLSDKLDSTYKWIVGTCLATIIGIAAMVVTVMVSK